MLMLTVFLLIGSVHAFVDKCPETCRQIELYLGEEYLYELEGCTEIKTDAYIEDLETTCEENVYCRKALSQSEFEYGGNIYTIYYMDIGCEDTRRRCDVMKDYLLTDDEYGISIKSCDYLE